MKNDSMRSPIIKQSTQFRPDILRVLVDFEAVSSVLIIGQQRREIAGHRGDVD